MSQRDRDKATAEDVLAGILGPSAKHSDFDSWRKIHHPKYGRTHYYQAVHGKRFWNFCYSITRNYNGKFISYIDRPSCRKVRIVEHKRRKDAKARALRLFDQFEHKGGAE